MKKILEWFTGGILKEVSQIVDDVVTTDEERLTLKNQLNEMLLSKAIELDTLKASIIIEESKGNFIQRAWRPIIMLTFGFVVVFNYALYPVIRLFNPSFPELPLLEQPFWNLLTVGIGGYIVGRSAEKIIPNIQFKNNDNASS